MNNFFVNKDNELNNIIFGGNFKKRILLKKF